MEKYNIFFVFFIFVCNKFMCKVREKFNALSLYVLRVNIDSTKKIVLNNKLREKKDNNVLEHQFFFVWLFIKRTNLVLTKKKKTYCDL